jgi:methyl coenzyme M reductase subunit D
MTTRCDEVEANMLGEVHDIHNVVRVLVNGPRFDSVIEMG